MFDIFIIYVVNAIIVITDIKKAIYILPFRPYNYIILIKGVASMELTKIAQFIDHTNLSPIAGQEDMKKLCSEAVKFGFKSVCVLPAQVEMVSQLLSGTRVLPTTVIGFPLGGNTKSNKVREAVTAYRQGAEELDMVINLAALKDKNYSLVQAEISSLVKDTPAIIKVIIETCFLSDEEKMIACELAMDAKAHFVKTSTGLGTAGATVHDVQLIKKAVGGFLQVKASGGIRSLETMQELLEAGAQRIGTSAGVQIMKEYQEFCRREM